MYIKTKRKYSLLTEYHNKYIDDNVRRKVKNLIIIKIY